jgi:hypothetical protein
VKTNLLAERMGYDTVWRGLMKECSHSPGTAPTKNDQVYCPGHLAIDLNTGRSLCLSLPTLPLTESDGMIRVAGLLQTLPVETTILGHNAAQGIDVG